MGSWRGVARAKTHNAINSSMLSLWERKTEVPERHQLPVSVYFKPLLFGLRLKPVMSIIKL